MAATAPRRSRSSRQRRARSSCSRCYRLQHEAGVAHRDARFAWVGSMTRRKSPSRPALDRRFTRSYPRQPPLCETARASAQRGGASTRFDCASRGLQAKVPVATATPGKNVRDEAGLVVHRARKPTLQRGARMPRLPPDYPERLASAPRSPRLPSPERSRASGVLGCWHSKQTLHHLRIGGFTCVVGPRMGSVVRSPTSATRPR